MGRSADLQRRQVTGGQRPIGDTRRPDLATLKLPIERPRSQARESPLRRGQDGTVLRAIESRCGWSEAMRAHLIEGLSCTLPAGSPGRGGRRPLQHERHRLEQSLAVPPGAAPPSLLHRAHRGHTSAKLRGARCLDSSKMRVAFSSSGTLACPFLRLRRGECGHDRLLVFSCKLRRFYPSCGTAHPHEEVAFAAMLVIPMFVGASHVK